ncbi:hypothetical protein NBO_11g0057 [Nosema bombycis CQ1]|uniref:Uncharacterized protein n=1 Tax=Nosema bombycis (strain CQ1 / CVCC 102059) TaxID=578461 RepID=R0KVR7_NOSB1|nr:hypothetical protein NBO_11g0057 [Nosema bombycis CQ1]|eukprot:EOB14986.1 hypothetical protein NBO_11g0057 [Nosema bombycis CQ1]
MKKEKIYKQKFKKSKFKNLYIFFYFKEVKVFSIKVLLNQYYSLLIYFDVLL